MEVDGLGARCSLASCNTLDYLPFTCARCANKYCSEHQAPSAHACRAPSNRATPSRTVPTCPLCSAPVPVPPALTADVAVSRHIDAGCPKRKRANPLCAAAACNVRDPAATTCPSCRQLFCLAHRIEATHDCRAVVSSSVIPVPAKKTRPQKTKRVRHASRRLDFVNSPTNPLGDPKLEEENRILLAVFFPTDSTVQPRYMYFSNKSSAGKIIDGLRKSIPQLPPPPEGERYYLYAVKNRGAGVNLLPYITPLRELGAVLRSGDMLVLEEGDQGLDPSWINALKGVSTSAPPKVSTGKRFGIPLGRSCSRSSRSDTCRVA